MPNVSVTENYPTIFHQYFEESGLRISGMFLSRIMASNSTSDRHRDVTPAPQMLRIDKRQQNLRCAGTHLRCGTTGSDTTSQVTTSVHFTQFLFCKNKIQLRANPVLQQCFTLWECKTHLKHNHAIVPVIEKILRLVCGPT